MKTTIILAAIFIGFLAAGCSPTSYRSLTENNREQFEDKINVYEQDENVGDEVILSLKNGTEINCELLSVRDSTITICTEHSATEEELASLKYPINTVRNDEIRKITIEGSNYVWTGLGIGILAGTGIGLLVGWAIVGDPQHGYEGYGIAGGGILGLIVGAIAGPIIGAGLSTDDVVIFVTPPGYNLSFMKPRARYPDEEPEYLRAIK